MATDLLYPSRIGAPGSLNIFASNGRVCPAADTFLLDTTDRKHYAIRAFETTSPSGTTTGAAPRQYCPINDIVLRLDNGTVTIDTTNFQGTHDAFTSVIQGAEIFDIPTPGTPGTFSQGTAGLIITFGNGNPDPDNATFEGCYYRRLDSDSTNVWTAATEATQGTLYMTSWQLGKAGADLYGVNDAGIASGVGGYLVSKCPAGNNPVLVASWGNGIEVGTPQYIINGPLCAIGDALVVPKGDGLYYYNGQTRRYENVLKHLELAPHALNGKCTASVSGGVVYTTHDGKAYLFDGVSVTEISPNKFWPILSRDIGNSRITAIADAGDAIDMISETCYQTTQDAGIVVNTVTSAGAATAITTNCIDGSMATGGDISSLAATSHIDIWADIPFEGVVIHITRKSNSTTTAVIGTVSYSSAADTFTADPNGFIDGTRLSSGGSFSYVAFPPSASAGVVYGKSINFGALQQAVNFNYSSGTDVTAKYGMRISMSGAALDASVEIDELEIIPFRAGMPSGGIYSATTNFTPRDRAGMVNHIYRLKRRGTQTFTPHDAFAVNAGPGVWAMAYHAGRLGQGAGVQNLGQSLIGWGRYTVFAVSEPPTRDMIRARMPATARVSTTKVGPLWCLTPGGWWGKPDEEHLLKVIDSIEVDTRFVQPVDTCELFMQNDERDIVSLGLAAYGGPLKWMPPQIPFRYCELNLGIADSVITEPQPPQYLEPVKITYHIVGGDLPRDIATPTPEAT